LFYGLLLATAVMNLAAQYSVPRRYSRYSAFAWFAAVLVILAVREALGSSDAGLFLMAIAAVAGLVASAMLDWKAYQAGEIPQRSYVLIHVVGLISGLVVLGLVVTGTLAL